MKKVITCFVGCIQARGSRIVGTFSASDLRGCSAETFQCWARESVVRFLKRVRKMGSMMQQGTGEEEDEVQLPLLRCCVSSPLKEVLSKALEWRVHRVWVVERQDILIGLVSFSDILRVVRDHSATSY